MDTLVIAGIVALIVLFFMWKNYQQHQKKHENAEAMEKLKEKQQINAYNKAVAKTEEASKASKARQKPETIPDDFHTFKLMRNEESHNEKGEDSEDAFGHPHPLFLALAKNITDNKELFEIVQTDPELVAKIINMANSAMFHLEKPITKLNHAMLFLGFTQVKNIATRFALEKSSAFDSGVQLDAYEKIWKACYLSSAMAFTLGKELDLENPGELSTACLLNYLGDIAILAAHPEMTRYYARTLHTFQRVKSIQKAINTNSAIMGYAVGKAWELPEPIFKLLGMSLDPMVNDIDEAIPADELRNLIFCYCICRVADRVIFEGRIDILNPDIDVITAKSTEFFYTKEQLERAQLTRLDTLFKSPVITNKLKSMIETAMQMDQ